LNYTRISEIGAILDIPQSCLNIIAQFELFVNCFFQKTTYREGYFKVDAREQSFLNL